MAQEKDTIPLGVVASSVAEFITSFSKITGDNTMPVQQVLTMLAVYLVPDINLADLEKYSGVGRSSNSRNVAKLGEGEKPWQKAGPGWIQSYPDPLDRRIVKCRMTPKGKSIMDEVSRRTEPRIRRMLNA